MRPQYGEPAPVFVARSYSRSNYNFGTVSGRYVIMFFMGTARTPVTQKLLVDLMQDRAMFDDTRYSMFLVSVDPEDEKTGRIRELIPGIRVFWDFDLKISQTYGVLQLPGESSVSKIDYAVSMLVLDQNLRGLKWFQLMPGQSDFWQRVREYLQALPEFPSGEAVTQAPVLMLPRVFEPEFCRTLIDHYQRAGGADSGFMRPNAEGKIEGVIDYSFKRRRDCWVEDEALKLEMSRRMQRRLFPEIQKAFRYKVTRMERYLIACYDAEEGGYFRPHRDNDGSGHRQFAVTLNLNADEYEGGDLKFPEYGQQTYRAPTGGACVFSCALLHEATPVTKGIRYAFVPFLYDEESARLREQNNSRYADPQHHYTYEEPRKGD